MTLQELDMEINIKKNEMLNLDKERKYNYIKEVLKENQFDNILDFINGDIFELIRCNIYVKAKNISAEEGAVIVNNLKSIFEKMNDSSLDFFLTSLIELKNNGKINILVEAFKEKSLLKSFKYVKDLNYNLVILLDTIKKNGVDLSSFFDEFLDNSDILINQIKLYLMHKKISKLANRVITIIEEKNAHENDSKKTEILTNYLKQQFDVGVVFQLFENIDLFVSEYERVDRINKKEIAVLNAARVSLEKNTEKKEIVAYHDIVRHIKDLRMKYCFLQFVKEHNEKYYLELKQELSELQQNSKVAIQTLLANYGITKDYYVFDEIFHFSVEELEKILKILSLFDISIQEKVHILEVTSIEQVLFLKACLDESLISISFVNSHLEIFEKNSLKLFNLKNNIGILNEYGILVSLFTNSMEVLLSDSDIIRKNLSILNSYNLLKYMNGEIDYSFLKNESLSEIIDKYLELACEEYLISDLSLLNKTQLKRLEIYKLIGIEVSSKEELEDILNEEKEFFIPLSESEEYLFDEGEFIEEPTCNVSLDELEQYKMTERVYNFDGILISVQKVQRLLNMNFSLYQAIIHNTNLSEEQIRKIINIISHPKTNTLKNV